ncbi:hypothetical protein [Streptomyces sp. 6N223]|uniref:hypothetical protein n=1 Tax=Streptomyces sp. 6N223 TaxID=3457412 RepID=UPI003FD4F613
MSGREESEGPGDAVREAGGGGAGRVDADGRGVVLGGEPPAGAGAVPGADQRGQGGERDGQAGLGGLLVTGGAGGKEDARSRPAR